MGKIAFARVLQHSSDIYAMNADGSGLTNLTHDDPTGGSWQAYDPAWSPDGRRIAFTGLYNEGRTQDPLGTTESAVFVMNADGSGRRRVTPPKPPGGHGYSHPAWLGDSRHLLVEGDDSASDSDLYLADVDGGSLRDLTNTPSVGEVDPQPSADGSRIVFSAISGGAYSVWTMNVDGTGRHQLQSCGAAPSWSPGGQLLAFTRADSCASGTGEQHVWVARADGSAAHRITTEKNPAWTGWNPAWTSDGRLLFVRDPDGPMTPVAPDVGVPDTGGGPLPGFIVIANADGSGEHQLTNPVPGQEDTHPSAWGM